MAADIASVTESINDALVNGRPTTELRRELARLEREQRTAATEAAAAERARRAEQEAAEEAEIHARATEVLDEIKRRIAERMAPLALSSASTVRRYPNGETEIIAVNMEQDEG